MSLQDSIKVPAFILTIAMTIFIAAYIWISFTTTFNDVTTEGLASGQISAAQNASIAEAIGNFDTGIGSMDYGFPIIVVGLLIVSLIFAFKSGAGVIYAILSVIMWALAIFFSMIYKYTFETFSANFPTIAADYPIIVWFMDYINIIVVVWVFLISVVMFTRTKNDDKIMGADQVFTGGMNV